jgi:hypothetical protein
MFREVASTMGKSQCARMHSNARNKRIAIKKIPRTPRKYRGGGGILGTASWFDLRILCPTTVDSFLPGADRSVIPCRNE